MPICRLFYGSDGTRTRDLRRDRPVRRKPATTAYDPELPATAGISAIRELAVTGCDRLAPGIACVADVWSKWCLYGQRLDVRQPPVDDRARARAGRGAAARLTRARGCLPPLRVRLDHPHHQPRHRQLGRDLPGHDRRRRHPRSAPPPRHRAHDQRPATECAATTSASSSPAPVSTPPRRPSNESRPTVAGPQNISPAPLKICSTQSRRCAWTSVSRSRAPRQAESQRG
jgi:hypothetical protein